MDFEFCLGVIGDCGYLLRIWLGEVCGTRRALFTGDFYCFGSSTEEIVDVEGRGRFMGRKIGIGKKIVWLGEMIIHGGEGKEEEKIFFLNLSSYKGVSVT